MDTVFQLLPRVADDAVPPIPESTGELPLPASRDAVALDNWVAAFDPADPGEMEAACSQKMYHALFDVIEAVSNEEGYRATPREGRRKIAHHILCGRFWERCRGTAADKRKKLEIFARSRMYRVLLTVCTRALKGRIVTNARETIGDTYYRDSYAAPKKRLDKHLNPSLTHEGSQERDLESERSGDTMDGEPVDLAELWRKTEEHSSYPQGGRPQVVKAKIHTSIDRDVLDWLKAKGPRYQTRMNAILKTIMEWDKDTAAPRDP